MTNTRKMATVAILSAVSFLLMYLKFPLIPTASFLEIDFSILPILVGSLILDLKSAFWILMIRSVLKVIFNNAGPTTLIGMPMNIVALAIFLLAVALIWKKSPNWKSYRLASAVGTLGLTAGMLVLNYFYAIPVYAAFANFDIEVILGTQNYLFYMVAPFNLLQGILFSLTFYIFYRSVGPILKKV